MTTLAYDGDTLAIDSRSSKGNYIVTDNEIKIFDINTKDKDHPYIAVAFCGEMRQMKAMVDWLQGDRDPDDYPCMQGVAVAITDDGRAHCYTDDLPYDDSERFIPVAEGSGGDLALGALAAGKTAQEAVEAAISLDLFSGGEVRTIDIKSIIESK